MEVRVFFCNPLLKQGEHYLQELKSAGFDGVLTVDLDPSFEEEPHPHFLALKKAKMTPIFVITPSTNENRLLHIAQIAEGFLYYACQKGTTGVRDSLPQDIPFHISRIRSKTDLPIAIGFGIANRQNASSALFQAEGFVVGSAFVDLMEKKSNPIELKNLARQIGAQTIIASISHGLFVGNSIENIESSPLELLLTTNTIPLRDQTFYSPKIAHVSIAKLIATAINKF